MAYFVLSGIKGKDKGFP